MATGTVLVIEGNPGALMVARNVLVKEGHQVATAADPGEGLRKARGDLPDVVILDVIFLGDEVLCAISAISPVSLPILISAPRGLGSEVQSHLPDIDGVSIAGVVEKPFQADALKAAVADCIFDHLRTREVRVDVARLASLPVADTKELFQLPTVLDPNTVAISPAPREGREAETIQETIDAEAACELIDVSLLGMTRPPKVTAPTPKVTAPTPRPARRAPTPEPRAPTPAPRAPTPAPRVPTPAPTGAVPGGFGVSARARRLATRIRRVTPIPGLDPESLAAACEQALRDEVLFGALSSPLSEGEPLVAGRVGQVAVPQVLQLAETFSRPVCCRFERDSEVVELVVHGRELCFGRQENLPEVFRLGRFLVELGVLAGRNLSRAVEDARNRGCRLGDLLREDGVVSKDDLSKALSRQATELVFELLAWTQGSFAITVCDPIPTEIQEAGVSLPLTGVLLDGLRRQDEWGPTVDSSLPS